MSEFLFKKEEEIYCEGFGYGEVSRLVSVGYAPRIVVDFDGGEAHCFTPDGYFIDPEEVKPGGFNPRLQSVNRRDKPDVTSSVVKLGLRPEGSVMEVVPYRKQLVMHLASGVLANPGVNDIDDEVFARNIISLADSIIKELEGESV